VLWLGRQRNRGDDGHSGFNARLAQWWKQPHLVHGVQSDAVGYLAQKSFRSLDHACAFEV
jgi:hypothetical protein